MFTFKASQHMPRFILQDKNGYALAKAIETGIQMMNDTIAQGMACINDYDKMPEWRLDELAWETNCLYDYNADVATKRQWIRNAIPLYRLFGTPQAVYQYIGSYFGSIDLEEYWQYNGAPYHFRVTVEGEWTPGKEAWARKAIGTAKNVRSVLDSMRIGSKSTIAMTCEGEVLAHFAYPMTGDKNWAGRWPRESIAAVIDESTQTGFEAEAEGQRFPYPMTGTRPEINTMGVTGENDIQAAQAEDTYARILYKLCGADEI